jgi:hypothetical protein
VTPLRKRVPDESQRRNHSPATIRGYILAIKQFAECFKKVAGALGRAVRSGASNFTCSRTRNLLLAPSRGG